MVAYGGVGAVGADHEVKCDLDLGAALLGRVRGGVLVEPGEFFLEVYGEEFVVEEESYVGEGLEVGEEGFVELCSVESEEVLLALVFGFAPA